MKRSELRPGMEVEIISTRHGFRQAIVVDPDPWDRVDGFHGGTTFRRASAWTTNRHGLAVAVRESNVDWLDPDHPIQHIRWTPDVVQLNVVFPIGTYADRERVRREAQAAETERQQTNEQRRETLAKRLGLRRIQLSYPYRRSGRSGGYVDYYRVEIPIDKLEALADRIDELEAQVAAQHTTPTNEPRTIDS